jgi:hypothetical protein
VDNFATKMKVGLVWASKSCQEAEFLEGYERGTETSASNFDTGASDVGNAQALPMLRFQSLLFYNDVVDQVGNRTDH